MAEKANKVLWIKFNDLSKLRIRLAMILSYTKETEEDFTGNTYCIYLNFGIQETGDVLLPPTKLYYSDSTLRDNDMLILDYYFGLCQLNEN